MQIQRNTGYEPNLYTGAELDAKAIQVGALLSLCLLVSLLS